MDAIPEKLGVGEPASDGRAPSRELTTRAEPLHLSALAPENGLAGSRAAPDDPPAEPPLPSLALVYDLAVRSYDYADRRYDTIGTRAAALIGFTSLLVTGAGTVVHRLSPYPGLWTLAAIVFLGLTAFLLYHAVCALFAREVDGLPAPEVLYHQYATHDERSFRTKMVSTFGNARDSYTQACEWKARHLRLGLKAFVVILFLLLPTLILVPDPPANSGVPHGEFQRK